ncbi:MAG: Rieske 2Fe-2S domain-containing protein [Marinibacterium sp.]|nr:Rieske 2Fe-2S domain-containing protein [Marinibacterium sp.]
MALDTTQATALALSAHIPPGDVHPAILNGFELAVWRDSAGQLNLWEDRCPHRGMRLSFGFVRQDRLTCLYHGWEFGSDSGCKRIPAHPDLEPPKTLCAKPFAVAERFGMVVLNGAPHDDGTWYGVRTIFVPRPLQDVAIPDISETPWRTDGPFMLGTIDTHQVAVALHATSDGHSAIHVTTTHPDMDKRLSLARALVDHRQAMTQETT